MNKEAICCPKFDPSKWDDITFEWTDKHFIMDKINTIFYMPIGFGKVMTKLNKQIDDSQAVCVDALCLSVHRSKWHMDVMMAVDKQLEGANNITLSGKYYSRVYEGPFQDMGKWLSDFDLFMKNKKMECQEIYTWYTTCPKCAKKYGHNYVVIIAKL